MKQKLINLFSHGGVKNSIWIIGEKVVQMVISFLITMVSARYLGPSNYGILNYGASFVTFFLAVTKLGLDSIAVNELINNPDGEGKILGTSTVMRLISSAVSIVMIFFCVFVLKPGEKVIIIATMLQSISLIFQAASFLDYWFQSKLQSKYVSIAKTVAYIVVSVYKVYLLAKSYSVEWFALSTVLDYAIICVFLFYFYKKKNGQKLKFNYKLGKELLKKSYHFIFSGIMIVIYTQIDKIMIGSMIDEAHVGFYSAALSLCSAWAFVPSAIITSARPSIYSSQKNGNKLYLKRLKQTFCIIFWICIAFGIIISLFSKLIVKILYGEQYYGAIIPLLILIWHVPFSQLGQARSIWIVGEGLNKYTKYYLMWGAILNIVLNSILIPIIGINGAAIATLITEVFVCVITPLFYKDTRKFTKLLFEGVTFNFD